MVIVVRLQCGMDYAVDSYGIDGQYIELRRTSTSGKQQLTKLPLEDILDLESPLLIDNHDHSISDLQINYAGISMES
jgi:hypothetical protein